MNFAIFCCLLASCAFQIVHATLKSELDSLHKKSVKQLTDHIQPTKDAFQELLAKAKLEKRSTDHCTIDSSIAANVSTVKELLQKCVDDAHKSKKLKKAHVCINTTVSLGKSGLDMLVDQAKMCFATLPNL